MKSSEQDGKGGEGRGLPAGWRWRPGTLATAGRMRLMPIDAGDRSDEEVAFAYDDGTWSTYARGAGGAPVDEEQQAQTRPGETLLAAAQAAAEAALWRVDGYGVGEVRGVRVPFAFEGLDDRMTRELPGLSGRWTISKWRDAEGGGVEVDAVRAPVPVDKVARRSRPMPPVAPGAGRGEGDEEDEPDPCAKHDTTGSNIGWQSWCPGCNVSLHREPAPSRGPSAPTDADELARLLRGPDGARLDDDIATVCNHAPEIWSGTRKHVLRVARACELLLADRERMAGERDRWKEATHKLASESACEVDAEIVALRARVAELEEMVEGGDREARNQRDRADEAERKLSAVAAEWKEMDASLSEAKEQLRIVSAGPDDVWRWAGDGGDDPASLACPVVMSAETLREFVAARERVAALEATPPPHTVAALLARVEEARRGAATKASNTVGASGANFQDGKAAGLREAASLIRATLTPSPLDGVVAEVCALPVEMPTFYASVDSVEDGLHAVDMLIGDHELPRRDRLARIARVALAGMLACDAAKGGARG